MVRLVAIQDRESTIIDFGGAETVQVAQRALRAEAQAIEAWRGPNPYSNFLLKNGRRPSCDEAATIGILMNARVKADDGSMQPLPSKAQRAQASLQRKKRAQERKTTGQIFRLRKAILALAANHESQLLTESIGQELGEDDMMSQLDKALECLNQIRKGFRRHEESKSD